MSTTFKDLKHKLEEQYAHFAKELGEERPIAHEGMGYSTHQADDASEAAEQAADLAMRQNAEHLLYEVERALYRIEQGTYGVCQHCGQPIDKARLEAIPYTRFCLTHASLHES